MRAVLYVSGLEIQEGGDGAGTGSVPPFPTHISHIVVCIIDFL